MPAGFESCVASGGRVQRVSGPNKAHGLKRGEYVNYCFLRGKAYRGEVKTMKGSAGNALRKG